MAEIDKVTIDELDVADLAALTADSKLIIETSDGKAKSVTKSALFNEESVIRETTDTLLQNQITTLAGTSGVYEKANLALKGAANGLAELDENGKVPMSQIPGSADDVRNCYGVVTFDDFGNVTDIQVYDDEEHTIQTVAETNIIYLDIGDTRSKHFEYMWSGTAWARLGSSIVIGEAASNAYRGDRGKIAYDHSQVRGTGSETAVNPHALSPADIGLGNVPNVTTNNQTPTYTEAENNTELSSGETLATAFGKIAKLVRSAIAHFARTDNPHSVTKAQVGLGNVENYGRATAVQSQDDKYITGGAVYSELVQKQDVQLSASVGRATTVEGAITDTRNAFLTAQGVSVVMYPAEANLPSVINFATGVVVAVGQVAWCVQERTWHRVTAINTETLAITWSNYDPHLAAELVAGKGIYIDNNGAICADAVFFDGSMSEWNALTPAEQAEYDYLATTDGIVSSTTVDAVEDGNLNPVTSNAVFDAIENILVSTTSRLAKRASVQDCNNMVTAGLWTVTPSFTNLPVAIYGVLEVFGQQTDAPSSESQWIWQKFYGSDNSVYIRNCMNPNSITPTNWNAWKQIV